MTVLLLPNLAHADEIVLQALKRRHGASANLSTRSDGPGIPLHELIEDDGSTYSAVPENRHYGKVTRRLSRLVYELNVHCSHPLRPSGLNPKSVYVVDIVHPATTGGRTGYLAITVCGPPVLVPLPELPPALIDGAGTVEDIDALRVESGRSERVAAVDIELVDEA
jgi:hypothetical protein